MLSAPAAASGRPAGADRAPSPTAPGGSPSPVCRIHGPPLTQLPLTATLRLHLGPRSPPPPGHPVSSLSRPLARWPLFTPASSGPGPQRLPSRPCGLPAPSHAALGGGRCLQNLATLTPLGPLPRQTDRQMDSLPRFPSHSHGHFHPMSHLPTCLSPPCSQRMAFSQAKPKPGLESPAPLQALSLTFPSVAQGQPSPQSALCPSRPCTNTPVSATSKSSSGPPSPVQLLPPPRPLSTSSVSAVYSSIRLFSHSVFTSLTYGSVEVTRTQVINAKSLALFFFRTFLASSLSLYSVDTLSSPKPLVTLHCGSFPVYECSFASFSICPDSALVPQSLPTIYTLFSDGLTFFSDLPSDLPYGHCFLDTPRGCRVNVLKSGRKV